MSIICRGWRVFVRTYTVIFMYKKRVDFNVRNIEVYIFAMLFLFSLKNLQQQVLPVGNNYPSAR